LIPNFSKLSINGRTILSKAGDTNKISNSKGSPFEFSNLPSRSFHPASCRSLVASCNSFLIKPDPSVLGLLYSSLNISLGS